MFNKAPNSIITDQDPAMKAAIKVVFPETVHRCCQWHVMVKAREKLLAHYGSKDGFEQELKSIVDRSLTVADFESSWKKMLKKYKLEDNSHLKTMYEKREEWVPAFFRGTFFANMSTTQRSEGMNAVMKLLVDNHTSIYRFVLQLEKLVEGIWQRESDEDFRSMNETPQLWSTNNMEVEARQVYTRKILSLFKKILRESSNGIVVEVERDRYYEVKITCHPDFTNWVPESHEVYINRVDDTVSCSCKGYEFVGLLCEHAIKVMQHVGMQNIPPKYIVKRWTKGANESVKRSIRERSMDMGQSVELESMRDAAIKPKLEEIRKLTIKSGQAFKYVDGILDEIKDKLLSTTASKCSVQGGVATGVISATALLSNEEKTSPIGGYIDPPLSQCKGRKRKPQRQKSIIEKNAPKKRTCRYYNKQDGHNFTTCPEVCHLPLY